MTTAREGMMQDNWGENRDNGRDEGRDDNHPLRRSWVRGVLAVLFVVVLVIGVSSVVGPRSGANTSPQVAVVVDSSQNMAEPGQSGPTGEGSEGAGGSDESGGSGATSRFDDVSDALGDFAEALPEELPVGLFAYGSEVEAPEGFDVDPEEAQTEEEDSGGFFGFFGGDDSEETPDPASEDAVAEACTDFRTVSPFGPVDTEAFADGVDSLEPTGVAGMSAALRSAAGEFSGPGPHTVVLVTSGVNDCEPPPCEAARDLTEQHPGLRVHVAGYRVEDADRQHLDCTARVTNGTYRQATDRESLGSAFVSIADRVAEREAPNATEIDFAEDAESAQFLGEGLYRSDVTAWSAADTAPREHVTRVAVAEEHNVYFSVTPRPFDSREVPPEVSAEESSENSSQGLPTGEVTITAENSSEECSARVAPETSRVENEGEVTDAATLELHQPGDGTCDPEGWTIRLQPTVDLPAESDPVEFPVEVTVQAEPRLPLNVVDTMTPGREAGSPPSAVEITEPETIVAGHTYNEATPIEPGSYGGVIVPGAKQYFRVPVEWGERAAVTLRAGPSVREIAEAINVGIVNPMRNPLNSAPVNFYMDERERTVGGDREVLYRNRQQIRPGPLHSMAGEQYVVVSMDAQSEERASSDIQQEYEFAVEVSGSGDEGPDWRPKNIPGPAPSDTPIAFGDGTDYEGQAQPPSEMADGEADSDEGLSPIWGALFALVLLVGGAGVVIFRARGDSRDDV